MNARQARLLGGLFLLLSFVSLLAVGVTKARRDYLSRGIPDSVPPALLNGGVQAGINVALGDLNDAEIEKILVDIKRTGFTYVKHPFYFNDEFDWTAAQQIVRAINKADLELVPLLDGSPHNNFAPPENSDQFANWTAEFAHRFGDDIDYYIIWDEPNLQSHWGGSHSDPAAYAALLVRAAAAIKQSDESSTLVVGPLAPTTESGPENLSEFEFVRGLLGTGALEAVDILAVKPYGFDTGPGDRRVSANILNFSRPILIRELLDDAGYNHLALWAGNWGWNSLPPDWIGEPSLWGQTTDQQRAEWSIAALERAKQEWPWMGLMFLENWNTNTATNSARQGFSIGESETAEALQQHLTTTTLGNNGAATGYHPANPRDPAQNYDGQWEFDPLLGADIGQSGDRITFDFQGTEVGLHVRRADYRARLYATIDGRPANLLPSDENGSALVLTSADPSEDIISLEWLATGLEDGPHRLELVASGGWDQWAIKGFEVSYRPDTPGNQSQYLYLLVLAAASIVLAVLFASQARLGEVYKDTQQRVSSLNDRTQLLMASVVAGLVAVSGWLTWGPDMLGAYRRLGDVGQIAATAAAATVFYVSPSLILYGLALLILFILLVFRPAWGVVIVAFSIPFYVSPVTKEMLGYNFSPLEVFTLVTTAAWVVHALLNRGAIFQPPTKLPAGPGWRSADFAVLTFVAVATLSLLFTQRIDVATNEWRVVVVEATLFYLLLRVAITRDVEMRFVLDAFVLGGLVVALFGLWQYFTGQNLITAEAGLLRLRSIYGSPNNVALYLGRIFPLLLAMILLGNTAVNRYRRIWYGLALIPIGVALILTFSKGALFLGIPLSTLIVFWLWQREHGRRTWPWALAALVLGLFLMATVSQVPQLANRLGLTGITSFFRLNLWRASANMVRDHPVLGVGLDNFLYEYRGRYIFDAAWQEPNLSHPHNIVLDFTTRLGLLGLIAGTWMFLEAARHLWRSVNTAGPDWLPAAVGFSGSLAAVLAHGLVDHSFFLPDLAYSFFLILGTAVWLTLHQGSSPNR